MKESSSQKSNDNNSKAIANNAGEKGISLPARFQPKLTIGAVNDPLEQEADTMADKVMRMPEPSLQQQTFFNPPTITNTNSIVAQKDELLKKDDEEKYVEDDLPDIQPKFAFDTPPLPPPDDKNKNNSSDLIQRKCAACEEEEKDQNIHRKENNSETPEADSNLENYVSNLNSSGSPLSAETKSFFEPRFNYDFSNVRVHTDSIAAKSADSINALAYTNGNNIVFNESQFSPGTDSGKRLLAHELTHVMQQESKNIKKKLIQRTPIILHTPGAGGNIELTVWGKVFAEGNIRVISQQEFVHEQATVNVPAGRRLLVQLLLHARLPESTSIQESWVQGYVYANPQTGRFSFEPFLLHVEANQEGLRFALDRSQLNIQTSEEHGSIRITAAFTPRNVSTTTGRESSVETQGQIGGGNIRIPRPLPGGGSQIPLPRGQVTIGHSENSETQVTSPMTSPSADFLLRLNAVNVHAPRPQAQPSPPQYIYLHTHDLSRTIYFGRHGEFHRPVDRGQEENLTQWLEMLEGNRHDPTNIWKALTEGNLKVNVRGFASNLEQRRGANISVAQGRANWAVELLSGTGLIPQNNILHQAVGYSSQVSVQESLSDFRVEIWIIERDAIEEIQRWLRQHGREAQQTN